jgi:hypothetical protein
VLLSGHLDPTSHFAIDWQSSSVAVLGGSWVEQDLGLLYLVPFDAAQLADFGPGMIAENEQKLQVVGQFVTKFSVLLMLPEILPEYFVPAGGQCRAPLERVVAQSGNQD